MVFDFSWTAKGDRLTGPYKDYYDGPIYGFGFYFFHIYYAPIWKRQKSKRRGWGPWRQDFYSFCSAHRDEQPDCNVCQVGTWTNHWGHLMGRLFFKISPRLWQWWVNR